jgi:peptide/nickel transport system ATP-binding protein
MQTSTPNVLSVKELSIAFTQKKEEDFVAVNQLSFALQKGKVLAIVGESGSGKSLTALSIMGLLPASAHTRGTINLYAHEELCVLNDHLSPQSWQQIRGNKIGMIFQEPMSSLNPVMTIGKQLSEALLVHQKLSSAEATQLALQWLSKVQIAAPEKAFKKYPHEMSGGQKQRVMIAMAMCNHPALLIADEPTTALDVTVQKEVLKLMKDLQQQSQTAMIFITHDLALASEIADEVLVLYKGEMVEYDQAKTIFHTPQHPYTRALIACKPTATNKGNYLPVVADFLNEKEFQPQKIAPTHSSTEKLLSVHNLKITFTETKDWLGKPKRFFKAVDAVSFDLYKGEVLGLVGESGCGKSTLSKSLMGLLPTQEGSIFYEGKDIANYSAAARRKLSTEIQMIFQDPYASLNPRLTIGEILSEPMQVHGLVAAKDLRKEVLRLLDCVQLPADSLTRYAHQFSGGQRQRIGIARALALKPKLLICDESVSALDVSIQAQILNLLKELQQSFQLSYLFISHDLSVVHYISDRVMVMQNGKLVEQGEATQVLQHPSNSYTQKLVAAIPVMN